MACVIVRGGKIIGRGFNMSRTHPSSPQLGYKQIHAEFSAVLNADYDVKGGTAYIFRQRKDGKLAMSRPCVYCHQFLIEQGIHDIVYSFDGNFVKEKLA